MKNMKIFLYHGSNAEVRQPEILPRLRALDFGAGFYLTSDQEQAIRWARLVARRRGTAQAILNRYLFNTAYNSRLRVKHFHEAGEDWLEFVVANRCALPVAAYDLIVGPVANDATLPVIDDYIDGRYTREEAIRRLLPQRLTDQYAFLTPAALAFLEFDGSEIL